MLSQMALFRALTLWQYNTSPQEKMDGIFPGISDARKQDAWYEEKVEILGARGGMASWAAHLDYSAKKRVVALVMAKYGEEALRWVQDSESGLGGSHE